MKIHLFYSLLLSVAIFSSCSNEDLNLLNVAQDQALELRSTQITCEPEGECTKLSDHNYQFVHDGCVIKIYLDVTRCDQSGQIIYYFEETIELLDSIGGSCTIDSAYIESAYRQSIRSYMGGLSLPQCSTEEVYESRFIKTQCQRYCIGPGSVGETNYYWTPCAEVQSCCVETFEWCRDGETLIGRGPTYNSIGDCEGTFTGTCHTLPPVAGTNPCFIVRCE